MVASHHFTTIVSLIISQKKDSVVIGHANVFVSCTDQCLCIACVACICANVENDLCVEFFSDCITTRADS